MKKLFAALAMLTLSSAGALGRSPRNNWQAVEDIPQGWRIAVVTDFTFPCVFVRATDEELVCHVPQERWDRPDPQETHVRRGAIREIRADRRNGANALTGAGLGGGAGAIFGAIATTTARGPFAYGFGMAGLFMGARAGHDVHLLKGKVIYRTEERSAPHTLTERSQLSSTQASQVFDVIAQTSP